MPMNHAQFLRDHRPHKQGSFNIDGAVRAVTEEGDATYILASLLASTIARLPPEEQAEILNECSQEHWTLKE
jgi:hypothetical protein